MKLQIKPMAALCDEKIDIRITELPPHGQVKLSASLRLPWAKGVDYASYAWFTADERGEVDLSRQEPDSGTYDYLDSMGPIVSVQRKPVKDEKEIARNIAVDESMFVDFTAECGQDRASARVERWFKTAEVKNQKISDEFVGEFFYPENSNRKTILVLGGSNGSLDANLPIASLLASRGYNVLTVAYFKEKGLPAALARIPLEYFERAFDWLKGNPQTAGNELYVLGISKGAELALLLAARYAFIKKVAAFAPHAYCFQAINFKTVSSWTYGGKDLPFIPLKNVVVFADALRCIIKNEPFGFSSTYKQGVDAAEDREAARIKIENAQADLILFAGEQDNIWNSPDGCERIMEALKARGYPHEYRYIAYPQAGHPFYAPYIIPAGESALKLAPRLTFSSGGTLQGNAQATADAWAQALEFFGRENN
jgi:dienelactone hydrolase